MAILKLDAHELDSPVWKKVEEYLEAELQAQREKNDTLTLPAEETAATRGRIYFIKETLKAARASKKPPGPGPA